MDRTRIGMVGAVLACSLLTACATWNGGPEYEGRGRYDITSYTSGTTASLTIVSDRITGLTHFFSNGSLAEQSLGVVASAVHNISREPDSFSVDSGYIDIDMKQDQKQDQRQHQRQQHGGGPDDDSNSDD